MQRVAQAVLLMVLLLSSSAWGETKLDPRWGHIYQWERGINNLHGEKFPAFLVVQKGLDMMYYSPESNPHPKDKEVEPVDKGIDTDLDRIRIRLDKIRGMTEVEPKCRWEWRQTTESGLTKFLNDGWKPTPLNYDEGKAMFPYLNTEYSKMIFWLKRKVCN